MSNNQIQNQVERLIRPSRQMLQDGKSLDDVLEYLKAESKSKMVSILVISKIMDSSVGDAKLLVHKSKAWKDVKQRDEEIHEKLISEIEKMSKKK